MLEPEIKLFQNRLPELLKQEPGKFALVKGEALEIFGTYEEAINAGLKKYGAGSGFLIRQILKEQSEASFPALELGLINVRI